MTQETDWTAVSDAAHAEWVDAEQRQRIEQDTPIGPSECPVTGRAFYGNMEHPDLGWVAMYGGPLDVYSIPALGSDDELRVERYDLDADAWVEGGEPIGYFYREQQPDHAAEIARLRAEADALRAGQKLVGYRWRHSAGEKWQYSDIPCGWEYEPLYAAMGADA